MVTGGIEYKANQPSSSLAPFVESIWMLANHAEEPKQIVVLPDGRVDVLFFYSAAEPYRVLLAGLESEPSHTFLRPKSVMFAVSFKLLAIEYVFNASIATLLNEKGFLPESYWDMSFDDMQDFDSFCRKVYEKINSLLMPAIDNKKQKMFDLIYESQGSITVKELSDRVHWSSRQINRYFNQWFGLSLKAYCTILRFRASFPHIKQGKLFPEHYFSDQAHFIKNVKKYSGFTPKELYKNKDGRFIQFSDLK